MARLTEEQLPYLFEIIADELKNAELYLNYYNELKEFLHIKYPDVFLHSPAFWENTGRVYFDAMTMCLIRAYDQNKKKNIGLKLLLQRIKENIHLFTDEAFKNRMKENKYLDNLMSRRFSQSDFEKKLKEDMNYVNHQKNTLVNNLKTIRNKSIFHKDVRVFFKQDDLTHIKVSPEEIKKLIDDGLEMLNFYSRLFNAKTFSVYKPNFGDHEIIFKVMQEYSEKMDAETAQTHAIMDSLL
jgi:hypothetical protein